MARRQEGGRAEEVAGRRHEAGGAACEVLPWVHAWSAMMSFVLEQFQFRLRHFQLFAQVQTSPTTNCPLLLMLSGTLACTHVLHPSHLPSRP